MRKLLIVLSASSAPVTDSTPYELRRAQELNAQLGPKGSQEAVDLLCDIHNTTSNMGLCLIFYSLDWITLHIYKYIQVRASSGHPHLYFQGSSLTLTVVMPKIYYNKCRL